MTPPPLVFLHGLGTGPEAWEPQRAHFAASRTVIAPRIREIADAAPAIDAVIAATGTADVCGLSLGGLAALQYAATHEGVRRLIVCAAFSHLPRLAAAEGRAKRPDHRAPARVVRPPRSRVRGSGAVASRRNRCAAWARLTRCRTHDEGGREIRPTARAAGRDVPDAGALRVERPPQPVRSRVRSPSNCPTGGSPWSKERATSRTSTLRTTSPRRSRSSCAERRRVEQRRVAPPARIVLEAAAPEEAEQGEYENDDQNDPENAQVRCLPS